jgi:16S rRNA (cytosine967-C5)-methyltransferase
MTPSARIAASIEILDEIIRQPRPADSIMSAYFRARKFIGSKDRTAIAQASYRALRRFLRLEWHLARAGAKLNGRNLVLAELLLTENLSAQDIAEIFSGQQYSPRKLTVDEQYFLTRLGKVFEPPEMPEHIKLECPAEYAEKFKAVFGENFETEMRGMMTEAPLDLRVNPQETTRDAAIQELKQNGVSASATPFSPFGIRVVGRPALPTLDLFKRGGVEIQDEGSQLIALLVGAKPGEQVVDFCAGAGGKTLAIAAQMHNKGRVVACDVLDKRLTRGRVRFTRAGLDNIQTRPLTNENDKWVKRSAGSFDRVLVDAPCSGTGVWRRNPDGRWKHLGPGLEELLPLQESILNSAARLVKPSGRLVYATCSLLPDENQMQVDKFLAAHADFKLVPVQTVAQDLNLPDTGDYMQLSPARHQTDGFFAAVMQRNG